MKGDCQRFGVARQRRFSVVWDGFSRGFPNSYVRAQRGSPIVCKVFKAITFCFYRKGRKEKRVLSDAIISLSPSAKSFLAIGFPRCARDKKHKATRTSTLSTAQCSSRGARECTMPPSRRRPAPEQGGPARR